MDLYEHLRVLARDPDHIEVMPATILREAAMELAVIIVARDGRSHRRKVKDRARRSVNSAVRDVAASQIEAMGRALADHLGIQYWSEELLDTEFPIEHNGGVARLRDFDLDMASKRLAMLRSDASAIMEGAALMEDAIRLMSQTGARTIGEAVDVSSR